MTGLVHGLRPQFITVSIARSPLRWLQLIPQLCLDPFDRGSSSLLLFPIALNPPNPVSRHPPFTMSGKYVFTKGLKELRFLFCQTSEHSAPTRCVRKFDTWSYMAWISQITPNRSFLQRAYPTMKKHNPHVPILMREASGTQPKVYARYGMRPS